MVANGSSSPDPSNSPNENLFPVDVGMVMDMNSESEEEEVSYEEYEALPQEIFESNSGEADISSSVSDGDIDSYSEEENNDEACSTDLSVSQVKESPSFDHSMNLEVSEVWNTSSSSGQIDIVMDSTKEEIIKNAMAQFKLPSSAIPPWAAEIPEEEWKEQLQKRVALLNKPTQV